METKTEKPLEKRTEKECIGLVYPRKFVDRLRDGWRNILGQDFDFVKYSQIEKHSISSLTSCTQEKYNYGLFLHPKRLKNYTDINQISGHEGRDSGLHYIGADVTIHTDEKGHIEQLISDYSFEGLLPTKRFLESPAFKFPTKKIQRPFRMNATFSTFPHYPDQEDRVGYTLDCGDSQLTEIFGNPELKDWILKFPCG